MSEDYKCQECGTSIQGRAELCIACFRKLHKPCPKCMDRAYNGRYRPRMKGKPLRPIDCAYCNNERWILAR